MPDHTDFDPEELKPGMVDADGNLKPGLTTDSYAGGVPSAGDLKPSLVDADGNLKPSLVDADGNLKPSLRNSLEEIMATAPTGSIVMYGGGSAPPDWLLCDGAAISRTTYAELFAIVGTTFGAGDGSTTFHLPNFARRVPVGSGGSGSATLGNAVGNTGGAETHALTTAQIPAHTHNVPAATELIQNGGNSRKYAVQGGGETIVSAASTGTGAAHNILQPSLVIGYIIKT